MIAESLGAQVATSTTRGAIPPVAGKRVLIVGINYWPEPTGPAPYTTGLAEHLAHEAASVQVLAGLPCYPTWKVPAPYRGGMRYNETLNGVDLTRLRHTVPSRQDAWRRGAYELSFLAHAASVRMHRVPDVVVGVSPALGGAVAAARIARRHRAGLMLIVQDLAGAAATQSGISGGDRVAGLVTRLESWALRQADTVVVVSDAFRRQIEAYGVSPGRVRTVPNWSRLSTARADRAGTRTRLGWPVSVKVALHTGNMGLKQDLGNVIEAARLTSHRSDLLWVLMGEGSQREALQQQAQDLPNLKFLPLCADEDYADILAAADVLLLNEGPDVEEMSLPSKLTSYFSSGLPVAAAVRGAGSSARELARAGAATPVEPRNPSALVELVLTLCRSESGARHGAAGKLYARTHLTPERAVGQLVELVADVCRVRPATA